MLSEILVQLRDLQASPFCPVRPPCSAVRQRPNSPVVDRECKVFRQQRVGSSVGQFDDEPVLPGLDAARQFGAELTVVQVLIHVRQYGAPRLHPSDPGQGLCEMRMGRVRLTAQAVDDPQLYTSDALSSSSTTSVEYAISPMRIPKVVLKP